MSIKIKKYLAAVSGGPDSMCMLFALKHKISGVCHVNYQKRKTANRDMLIVKNFCYKNKIPLYCLKVTKKILSKYTKYNSNFQNAARAIRYDFFVKCANKAKNHFFLMAHNKDDFLETALMQKHRHSQSLFFGIKDVNTYKDIYILRPLLKHWKSSIISYCHGMKINYGIDETNNEPIYERNKIRKDIQKWSILKKTNEYRKIINYNKSHKALSVKVDSLFNNWFRTGFNVSYFRNIDYKISKYLIYEFLITNNILNISSSKIQNVIQFITSNKNNKKLRLGNDIYLHKHNGLLIFTNL